MPAPSKPNKLSKQAFKLSPASLGGDCEGTVVTIGDVSLLAKQLAALFTSRAHSLLRIIKGLDKSIQQTDEHFIRLAINRLQPPIKGKTGEQIEDIYYKRDGLLLQHMAWLVSAHQKGPTDLLQLPHIRYADHGFDGLVIRNVDQKSLTLAGVEICEQKATTSPRDVIREKVWPEFKTIDSGIRDDEILSETTALLSLIDAQSACLIAKSINFKKARRFRATVTTEPTQPLATLMDGFDATIPGKNRRAGEAITLTGIRNTLAALAKATVIELKKELRHV